MYMLTKFAKQKLFLKYIKEYKHSHKKSNKNFYIKHQEVKPEYDY